MQWIEGLDNEITLLLTFILVIIGMLCYCYFQHELTVAANKLFALDCHLFYTEPRNRIHPAVETAVMEFRRLILGGRSQSNAPLSESQGVVPEMRQLRFNDDRMCPICYGPASFAVVTNCGHLFCCSCIYGYWQHSASLVDPVKCAVCRESVNLLIPSPVEGERENNVDAAVRCEEQLVDYNRRFSGARRPLIDYLRDIPVLVPYMLRALVSVSGLMFMFRVRVFLCLLGLAIYVLSPFDILPEAAFGVLGLIDDVFIVVVVLIYATILFRQLLAGGGIRFGWNLPE